MDSSEDEARWSLCLLCREEIDTEDETAILECTKDCRIKERILYCEDFPIRICSLWFHKSCYQILMASYKKSKRPSLEIFRSFAAAVEPLHTPANPFLADTASTWEGLVSHSTKRIMAGIFRQELFMRLPVEIQSMIVDRISPCRYLIVLGETRRLIEQLRNVGWIECELVLNLKQTVYVTKTKYQGNLYISGVSNSPLEAVDVDQERLELPICIEKIILSVDHIGVRRLQFLDHNTVPSSDDSPWYEIVDIQDSDVVVHVRFDGLFVRNLRIFRGQRLQPRIWSLPDPPDYNDWNVFGTLDNRHRSYVKLGAGIQGILACCAESIIGIHGFRGLTKEYKSFNTFMEQLLDCYPAKRIFFPFHVNEVIQGAWVRRRIGCEARYSSPTLIIRTSLGRVMSFGPHPLAALKYTYDFQSLLKRGDGTISGLFYDGMTSFAEHSFRMGVICDSNHPIAEFHESEPSLEQYLAPSIESFLTQNLVTMHLTKAPLEGILKVRIWRDHRYSCLPFTGLLLYYENGNIESLGQIRLHEDFELEIMAPICIEHGVRTRGNLPFVKGVHGSATCPRSRNEDCEWQTLPLQGTIVWWTGYLVDKIDFYE
ncbi:hypothetical protein BO71DRAFT_140951 [Aspergillus ellipticus CBS 707.79]|uniref:Uncharacterized protein n=1 Tax=Aspergillus ellipticus CBS 707.79 TaxID=1448320 RepID=A0A319CUF9_9EURO|nr:hypothetical protein BO71DRAFT_140951 [Aspergillus ellipticus CBS 707.79]